MKQLAIAALCSLSLACSYRPARFADRPAVTLIEDEPIPVPERTPYVEAAYVSDAYFRRPVLDVLDVERVPYARDVNCLDDVPRSSFWDPPPLDARGFELAYSPDGPPEPPLARQKDGRIVDRKGRIYYVRPDPPGLPKTRSAAAIIASRLARALGYRTEQVWPYATGALARGPLGIPLGPTAMTGTRDDDPNDWIEHRDRRTLRALGLFAAWIDLPDLGPERVVDYYVGTPGRGRVEHFVVELDDALGASALIPAKGRETAAGIVRGGTFENLVTLGLARLDQKPPREKSLMVLSPRLPGVHELSRPWEPIDRLLVSDSYWLAKRIAALPPELIERIVARASLPQNVHAHVVRALEARRTLLIARTLVRLSPLEPVALERPARELVIEDVAIRLGYAPIEGSAYHVTLMNDDGDVVAPPGEIRARGERFVVPLSTALRDHRYVVVRVFAKRHGRFLPRAFEAHVRVGELAHVVGVRH